MRLDEVAALVSGVIENGDRGMEITAIQDLQSAGAHDAAFLSNLRLKPQFESSHAGVVILGRRVFPGTTRPVIRVDDPYLAFALLQRHFHPQPRGAGRHSGVAFIDPTASIAPEVDIAPMAVIGPRASIGPGSRIGAGCVIEADAVVGADCVLHARAVVCEGCVLGARVVLQPGAVIGADGFGYAWSGDAHLKIPQVGRVILEDDVEIGANTCVDRGAIGDTLIRKGVKLDNLIQIGHNVVVGEHSIMASQVGISGSTTLGRGCQIGGQAGIAGHLEIGDGCRLAAQSGVMGDLAAGGTYAGSPAMLHRQWLKVSALLQRLPDLLKSLNSGPAKR